MPLKIYFKEYIMKKIDIINDEYLTPEQFHNKYGISIGVQTKMRMRKNRDKFCDFLKIGRAILYKQSDVDEWLTKQKVSNE